MEKHLLQHWPKYFAAAICGLLLFYFQGLIAGFFTKDTVPVVTNDEIEQTAQLEDNENIMPEDQYIRTASGLGYKVIKQGEGTETPSVNSRVVVHYVGTLEDGTIFDSSRARGETIAFGLNQVIAGWTEGLQLMHVGDVFEFNIPAVLAYGDNSPSPLIPANSDLNFEVELFEIQ